MGFSMINVSVTEQCGQVIRMITVIILLLIMVMILITMVIMAILIMLIIKNIITITTKLKIRREMTKTQWL